MHYVIYFYMNGLSSYFFNIVFVLTKVFHNVFKKVALFVGVDA